MHSISFGNLNWLEEGFGQLMENKIMKGGHPAHGHKKPCGHAEIEALAARVAKLEEFAVVMNDFATSLEHTFKKNDLVHRVSELEKKK